MSFDELRSSVIEPGLCTRCGTCAGVCPVRVIGFDSLNFPTLRGDCTDCGLCTRCCPGADIDLPLLSRRLFNVEYAADNLQGYVENTFVAHASVSAIREAGTAGGLVTGLLAHLLETNEIDGALVVGPDPDRPYRMKGVLAKTTAEIINGAQSKYCITPSMEMLQKIRKEKGRFAVVGLPCQVQGVRKMEQVDPGLAGKIHCVFGLYCHCNMEPYAHVEALKVCNIDPDDVAQFSFRGGGWPGGFQVVTRDGRVIPLHKTLYTTILNVMFKIYGAERCSLCCDGLSEYADLSFGDFWAQDYTGEYAAYERSTLVSQRTARGKDILKRAAANGAITLYPLPDKRRSKRIANMARRKKNRCFVRMERRRKKKNPCPDYHFPLPALQPKARRQEYISYLMRLLRGPMARKIVMSILFSPLAPLYERVNLARKKIFCDFHGN